jgi:hypothetical protein
LGSLIPELISLIPDLIDVGDQVIRVSIVTSENELCRTIRLVPQAVLIVGAA